MTLEAQCIILSEIKENSEKAWWHWNWQERKLEERTPWQLSAPLGQCFVDHFNRSWIFWRRILNVMYGTKGVELINIKTSSQWSMVEGASWFGLASLIHCVWTTSSKGKWISKFSKNIQHRTVSGQLELTSSWVMQQDNEVLKIHHRMSSEIQTLSFWGPDCKPYRKAVGGLKRAAHTRSFICVWAELWNKWIVRNSPWTLWRYNPELLKVSL